MRKQRITGIVIIIIIVLAILGINNRSIFNDDEQVIQDKQQIKQENLTIDEKVDQIVASMSQTEKLGQMVMIGIQGTKVDDDSLYMLNQYHMGGVILFDRNMESPEQVKQLTSDLQAQSNEKVPLFIGIDEEGGDVVRMAEKLTPPPSQKEIGATGDIEQAKTWAIKTAKSLKDMGINVNFAPVADVGSNDKRSYSTDTNTVIDFVRAATKGYQQENIIYSLKHFPGIGKGRVDSHVDSSSIDVTKGILMAEDIIPFKTIIDENEPNDYFILVSHLKYLALDEEYPASLSSKIMTDLLRNELGYKGIIITDDMEMGAVANHNDFRSIGVKAVKAVKAGADIVLVCHEYKHQQEVYLGLLDAVNSGEISQERIDESVKRIIKVKLLHLYQ